MVLMNDWRFQYKSGNMSVGKGRHMMRTMGRTKEADERVMQTKSVVET